MIKIKYGNSDAFINVQFRRDGNIITLIGTTEKNTSGFSTYRLNGEKLGDFPSFVTVYRFGSDFVQYSNDGSIWIEPEPEPEPEPDPKPSLEQRISDL